MDGRSEFAHDVAYQVYRDITKANKKLLDDYVKKSFKKGKFRPTKRMTENLVRCIADDYRYKIK